MIITQVITHLEKKFAALQSPNKLKAYMGHGAKAWVSDFNHPHYMAGRKAMKTGKTSGSICCVDENEITMSYIYLKSMICHSYLSQ